MIDSKNDIWYPSAEQIAASNITQIMPLIGVSDYDELYRFSVDRPAEYWKAILQYSGVIWSKDYTEFSDLSTGPEFPKWFVGGALNWTDTIFKWAHDPATCDKVALIAETEEGKVDRVTYRELHERVRSFAAGLLRLGLNRGDRVAFLMEPGVEAVISIIAISYIGSVMLPLFSGFGADPIVSRLSACNARALIMTSGFTRRGTRVDTLPTAIEANRLYALDCLILKLEPGEKLPVGAIDWASVAVAPVPDLLAAQMDTHDPAMVFYTSGTTGKPKGIVHTHGGFPLKVLHDGIIHFDIKTEDVFFWPSDMGWVAGAMNAAAILMRGATLLCYSGAPDCPDWSRMSSLIERHQVTVFGTAPTMIRGFAAHEEAATRGDLSSIRLLITGGEVIDPENFVWHERIFGRGVAPLINFSGGTEVSSALVSSVIVKPIPPGGFNTAAPGICLDVVDVSGESLVGEVGELAVRQPFVGMTKSFWQDDERYLDTYWRTIPGVWLHGDLAIRTTEGHYFLRGRSDDTLKLAGKRIGPAEIEDVLMEFAGVSECAAIGVDDVAKGQLLVVFVIPTGQAVHDVSFSAKVALHAERRLGRAFRPGRVHVVTELPKTRTAKIMRRVLRGVYCGLPPGDLTSLDNPSSLEVIRQAAAEPC